MGAKRKATLDEAPYRGPFSRRQRRCRLFTDSGAIYADRAKTAGIRGESQGEERAVRESERLGRIGRLKARPSRPESVVRADRAA